MTYDDYDEKPEHECPRALEQPVDEFDVGGQFLSPAGRWERITSRTPHSEARLSARIVVHTDAAGGDCVWTFWKSTKFPYIPSWSIRPRFVCVMEVGDSIQVEVSESPRSWGHGHALLSAYLRRGEGWEIVDSPDGRSLEKFTVANKAKARTEVKRRARAHAKRLGIAVYRPEATS